MALRYLLVNWQPVDLAIEEVDKAEWYTPIYQTRVIVYYNLLLDEGRLVKS